MLNCQFWIKPNERGQTVPTGGDGMHRGCDSATGDWFANRFLTRWLLLTVVMIAMSMQTGCQIFRRFDSTVDNLPVLFNELPTQQQLLSQMSARAARVRQLNSSVAVSMPGTPKIKGTLQVEFPDRMRMKAGLMGVSEMGVDVGSNRDHFWIWSKASLPNQPPAFYFANHQAFQRSAVRQSVPLDPKWLIDALGLVEFGPTDVHHGPTMAPGNRMKLFTVQQTPTGPQTRVFLLGTENGLIQQQAIYDASNRLIAYSNSSNYRNYADAKVSLPQRIEIHLIQPDERDGKIVIDMGTFAVGTPGSDVLFGDPAKMWAMPNPGGVPKIDLTQVSNVFPQDGFPTNSNYQPRTPAHGIGYSRN